MVFEFLTKRGIKVKKILLLMISMICIAGSFTIGFYYCKQQVISGDNNIISSDIDHIAIVNLDEGISKNNEKILYSAQLLKFSADYAYVGLNEAKNGIETGMYAAYIIIPADFSACIESINRIPQKIKIEYVINESLTDKNRLETTEKLNTFKELLNSNAAYVYLSSVLGEFHSVQDSAVIILDHDKEDLKNIENINPDEIFTMIDFSETKQTDNTIEDVDLTDYLTQNATEVDSIISAVDNGITEGQKKYSEIEEQYGKVTQEINRVQNALPDYNPLCDEEGNKVYQDGLEHLHNAIDEYNSNVDLKGEEGGEEIKQMITEVAEQCITSVLEDIQKNTDSELENIQEKNTEIVRNSIASFNAENNRYYDNMNEFIKKEMSSYIENNNNIITNMKTQQQKELEKITDEKKETFTKSEVRNYIEKIITSDLQFVNNIEQKLENSPLLGDYKEEVPQLLMEDVPLPKVKMLYHDIEGDNTQENDDSLEQNDTEENVICIDIDKNIDERGRIEKAIENQEENITGLITDIKESFLLSKSDITGIIDEQIIGKIETENQNKISSYSKTAADLVTSINEYDNKITKFNPYDYIKKEEINKHNTALSKNIMALGNAMNEKNGEYLEFVNKVYETANENTDILQKDMQTANDESKKNLNTVITKLKTDKNNISQEDNDILESFSKKLSYSRLGSQEYSEMYKFMTNPIETTVQYGKGIVKEEEADKVKINYGWVLIGSSIVLLLPIMAGFIVGIVKGRKELREIENE